MIMKNNDSLPLIEIKPGAYLLYYNFTLKIFCESQPDQKFLSIARFLAIINFTIVTQSIENRVKFRFNIMKILSEK